MDYARPRGDERSFKSNEQKQVRIHDVPLVLFHDRREMEVDDGVEASTSALTAWTRSWNSMAISQ